MRQKFKKKRRKDCLMALQQAYSGWTKNWKSYGDNIKSLKDFYWKWHDIETYSQKGDCNVPLCCT